MNSFSNFIFIWDVYKIVCGTRFIPRSVYKLFFLWRGYCTRFCKYVMIILDLCRIHEYQWWKLLRLAIYQLHYVNLYQFRVHFSGIKSTNLSPILDDLQSSAFWINIKLYFFTFWRLIPTKVLTTNANLTSEQKKRIRNIFTILFRSGRKPLIWEWICLILLHITVKKAQ